MAPLAKVFVVFALAIFASALTNPHISHNIHQHRALALQKPTPMSDVRRKRSLNKRCASQPSTNGTATAVATTTASATPSAVPMNVAPKPATSDTPLSPSPTPAAQEATPTPTPTPAASSAAPAATSSTADSSSYPSYLVGTQSGQGTFYETGLGACGITNTDSQLIAAVSWELFDSYPGYDGVNPNTNPVCGKQVKASYQGKSTTVTITDRCTGCALTDLDFSPSAFTDLANESLGRIGITWVWV